MSPSATTTAKRLIISSGIVSVIFFIAAAALVLLLGENPTLNTISKGDEVVFLYNGEKTNGTIEEKNKDGYIVADIVTTTGVGLQIAKSDLVKKVVPPLIPLVRMALGVLIGYISCIVRILMLNSTLKHITDMPEAKAAGHAKLQFLVRYAVCAAFLIAAALGQKYVSLYGAVLGVISMQFGAYLTRVIFKENIQ
ncbi:MAG: hypothetical protein FWE68_06980 [Defluviitaleaceae bacterium]|nr:hypothetical protein [Defluviitaleaceae bacterium]